MRLGEKGQAVETITTFQSIVQTETSPSSAFVLQVPSIYACHNLATASVIPTSFVSKE
jgi:hypothetical protein